MGRLFDTIHKRESDELSLLRPLLQNKCVALAISDVKMYKKKRVKDPILLISPMSLYGLDKKQFLFSIPGYGSEIVDLDTVKAHTLSFRLGLTMKASNILINEIKSLFK